MSDWLDDKPFYELCQQYRHSHEFSTPTVVEAYEALKDYIRERIEEELEDASEAASISEQNNRGRYEE
jgi:hypothetical protein